MKTNWNRAKLNDLKNRGRIKGYHIPETAPAAKKVKKQIPAQDCKEVQWMKWNLQLWCNEQALELLPEHKFHPERKWRFDFALPALKVGIEYEGLNSDKSRHTTLKGFTGDSEKYNAAQAMGWRVIRVTVMNYRNILQLLKPFVNQ